MKISKWTSGPASGPRLTVPIGPDQVARLDALVEDDHVARLEPITQVPWPLAEGL